MSSSVLVGLGLAAEMAAVGFSAIAGYRAFSLSRALPGPVYRVRAEWTWIFSVILIGVTVVFFGADSGVGGSFVSQFLTGVNVYMTQFALVVPFAWVSSTFSVAFEEDFFHRDTLHWNSLRIPFWLGVTTAVLLSFFAAGIEHCTVECVPYFPYEPLLKGAAAALVVVLMVYSSAILYVTAARTPDKILERHLKWLGPFVAAAALALVVLPIYGVLVAFGSFFLFRASRFLSPSDPLTGAEACGAADVPQGKRIGFGWQKYRTISILAIITSLVLAALILAEDGLLKKLAIPSGEALTSVMIVYGVLIVLLVTKTRLGFTLGLISSSLMLFAQAFNDLAPPNGFIS